MEYDHLGLQIGLCLTQGPRSAEELVVAPARIHYAIRQRLIGISVTPSRHDSRVRVIEWGLIGMEKPAPVIGAGTGRGSCLAAGLSRPAASCRVGGCPRASR